MVLLVALEVRSKFPSDHDFVDELDDADEADEDADSVRGRVKLLGKVSVILLFQVVFAEVARPREWENNNPRVK